MLTKQVHLKCCQACFAYFCRLPVERADDDVCRGGVGQLGQAGVAERVAAKQKSGGLLPLAPEHVVTNSALENLEKATSNALLLSEPS